MAVATHEFWRRAQLSKDVLAILNALDAAASQRLREDQATVLKKAVQLLESAKKGALNIETPDISTRWAMDALKFRSAADALSRIQVRGTQRRPELIEFLDRIRATLAAISSWQRVEAEDLEATRVFFHAFEESLVQRLGTFQEKPPSKYL